MALAGVVLLAGGLGWLASEQSAVQGNADAGRAERERIATLEQRMAAIEPRIATPPAPSVAPAAVAELERRLAAVEQRPAAPPAPGASPETLAELERRLAAIEQRPAAPQAVTPPPAVTSGSPELAPLADRVAAAEAALAPLADRLARIEATTQGLPERIGAAEAALAPLADRLGRVEATTQGLPERIGAAEAAAGPLAERLQRIETATNALPDRIAAAEAALTERIARAEAAASDQIARVEAASTQLGERIGGVEQKLSALEQGTQGLRQTVEPLPGALAETRSTVQGLVDTRASEAAARRATVATALGALLRTGQPLGPVLEGLPAGTEVAPELARLRDQGAPSRSQLLARLDEAERAAEAQPTPVEGNLVEQAWSRLNGLMTVRRNDEVVVGSDAARRVAAARAALREGNLAAARAAMEGEVAPALVEWRAAIDQVLAAERAIAALGTTG